MSACAVVLFVLFLALLVNLALEWVCIPHFVLGFFSCDASVICSDVVCQRGEENLPLPEGKMAASLILNRQDDYSEPLNLARFLKVDWEDWKTQDLESPPLAHVFEMCAENSPPGPTAIPVSFFSSRFLDTVCGNRNCRRARTSSLKFQIFLAVVRLCPHCDFPQGPDRSFLGDWF